MRARLRAVAPAPSRLVDVAAQGVAGHAEWRGDGLPPAPGEFDADVELEFPTPLDWAAIALTGGASTLAGSASAGTAITTAGDASALATPAPGELVLHGVAEGLDNLGVLTLRIADAVVLVDTTGEPPAPVEGQRLTLRVRDAQVYPTGI